jgi:hypothetical protein
VRKNVRRDVYEKVARKERYEAYKSAIAEINTATAADDDAADATAAAAAATTNESNAVASNGDANKTVGVAVARELPTTPMKTTTTTATTTTTTTTKMTTFTTTMASLLSSRSKASRRQCGVFIGHHRGDVQENVISNVSRYKYARKRSCFFMFVMFKFVSMVCSLDIIAATCKKTSFQM